MSIRVFLAVLVLPPESHSKDVLSLLLACLDVPQPDAALLVFSVRHRNPVLAVLAACFQVGPHRIVPSFSDNKVTKFGTMFNCRR